MFRSCCDNTAATFLFCYETESQSKIPDHLVLIIFLPCLLDFPGAEKAMSGLEIPPLAKQLSAIGANLQRKRTVFSNRAHYIY